MNELLIWFAKVVAGKVIGDEVNLWLSGASGKLVYLSTRLLNERDRSRYAEEWAADLSSRGSCARRFVFALGTLKFALQLRHFARHSEVSFFTPYVIRAFEFFVSIVVLFLALPIFAVVSLCILCATKGRGPVITRRKKRDDVVWNAEGLKFFDEPLPRKARVFLYRTGLVDFPIFASVVSGKVSFVGRSEVVTREGFEESPDDPVGAVLSRTKPGIMSVADVLKGEEVPPITLALYISQLKRALRYLFSG